MYYLLFSLLFTVICLTGCADEVQVIEIDYQKDLIPEGIAYHPEKSILYLSSIYKDKLIAYDLNSGMTKDLITSGQYGYKHGIGIEIKDNKLFALSSALKNDRGSSLLLVFDLEEETLIGRYQLKDTVSHFMNDLAISQKGQIFITDTGRSVVYKLDYPDGDITLFMEDESIKQPNGIAISDDDRFLYVDSWTTGIRIVDLSTGTIVNSDYSGTDKWMPVDGLKYYKGDLYGIRNGFNDKHLHGLLKLGLSEDKKEIDTILPLLINHPKMNIPTTFSIHDGYAYILANSQMDRLNQSEFKLVNSDSLTDTYVLKVKL